MSAPIDNGRSDQLARIAGNHITAEIANQVLFAYDRGGYGGDSLTAGLISLISAADEENKSLLAKGFFGYVAAVRVIEADLQGVDVLRRIGGIR